MDAVYSIYLRLDRAQEHLDAMNKMARAFIERHPYSIWRDDEADGQLVWKIRFKEKPPAHLSVILADCISNLRSALDFVMWQLASRYKPGRPSSRTQFPICTSPEEWAKVRHAIRYMPEDAIRVIEAVQPHVGEEHRRRTISLEGHPFRVLHKVWNREKHRELTDLGFMVSKAEFGERSDYGFEVRSTTMFEDETVVARGSPLSGDAKPDVNGSFAIEVGFDPAKPEDGAIALHHIGIIHGGIRDLVMPYFEYFLTDAASQPSTRPTKAGSDSSGESA